MAKNPTRYGRYYRRRRYYSDSHRLVMAISAIISDKTSEAKSVKDLRNRLRKLVDDNHIWAGVAELDKLVKRFGELLKHF